MKKLATLCLIGIIACMSCFATTAWGSVSLSAFPDHVFREYLKQYDTGWKEYDSNGEWYTVGRNDGILDDKEIERITSVSVHGVASLEGIRYLTALEQLSFSGTEINLSGCPALAIIECSYSQLTSLNISNCPALTTINCSNNPLTTININGCPALKYLDCSYGYEYFIGDRSIRGKLTHLNVNHLTSLTSLNCRNNQLTALNVSNCSALNYLDCSFNCLTEIDVSHNTALNELWCGYNQLAKIDVSNLTSLTKIWCENNPLTEFNASNCTSLCYVNWGGIGTDTGGCRLGYNSGSTGGTPTQYQLTKLDITNCTAIKYLDCSNYLRNPDYVADHPGNQLTELDLRGCTALTYLNCTDNQLMSLDVSDCVALTMILCNNNQLTSLDVRSCTNLIDLYCECNQLTSLDVSHNTALTNLYCVNNQLKELDVTNNASLAALDCSGNQLTELDLTQNTLLSYQNPLFTGRVHLSGQKRRGLNVNKTSEGYEVNMKDYVSHPDNIEADSISPKPISYNKETGIITFSEPMIELCYNYITHSPNNELMYVTITNPLSIVALERYSTKHYGTSSTPIICNMTDDGYLNYSGNPITESDIYNYSYSDYGKLGLAADGNSRLIIRVQTDKPGKISFSFNDDIGAKLESLSRKELSASDQLSTSKVRENDDTHQVSAVLVAPERFPKDKNFPSDTFKIHVKFTDEDGKVTEDDLELKLEAAPVILIPGMLNMVGASFFLNPREIEHNFGDAYYTFGVNNNSGIWRELLKSGFKKEHIALFNHNITMGVKNNVNALFDCLKNMFDTYDKEGIVCTKADVVAHGLGGLLVRQYLDESSKDSSSFSNNNWSEISYKQGMIHKFVSIAVPHRGTPLANVMLGDMSVINNDLPPGIDRLAYRVIKYFPSMIIPTFNGASKETWKDLAIGSDVVNLPFPANVPMHFIYGDVKYSLDELEKVKNTVVLFLKLASLAKTLIQLPGRVNELSKAAAPLEKVHSRAILEDGIMDKATFEEARKLLNKNNLLRFQEFMKALLEFAQNGMSFAEMAKFSPNITGLMQVGGVALDGAAGLLTMPVDLYFVIPRLIFSGQAHDKFVPVNSAIAAFPEYSTGFPETPNLWDVVGFEYSTLCQQYSVAEFVGYLLKTAPMSEFAVLKESVPLPGTKTSSSLSRTIKAVSAADDNSDIEIDFDNFYVKNFGLTIRKSIQQGYGDGMTALKFIANASIKTSNDVKLVVQKDSFDRIFPMFKKNENIFEAILVFKSEDVGELTAYCYAPSGKGNLYISDTVNVDVLATPEEEPTPPIILTKTISNGIVGQSCSLQLEASGTAPMTWAISEGKLPDGLKLDASTGKITGTFTKAGTFKFTVKVTDNNNLTAVHAYTVKITKTTISGSIPTIGKVKVAYTGTLKASGGTSAYKWSISKGSLPDGLKINTSTGKITGTPTKAGTFNFTVKVTDKNSIAATKAFTVKVTQTTIDGTIPETGIVKASYTGTLKVSGGTSAYTWTISKGALPDGLKINASTGKITGKPTKAGTFSFTVKVTDKNGVAATKTFKVKITQTTLTATIPATIIRGKSYTWTPKATGGTETYKWTISEGKLPDGLKINASTGKITGTPTKAGTFNFTLKVMDKNSVAATKAFTVKVTQTTIDGTIPTTGIVKASFIGTLKATGGTSAYTWSISKGALPDGLKINASTGKITGKPTKAGTFSFTVKVTDKNGMAATKAFKVKVTKTTLTATLSATIVRGKSYTWTPKVTGGTSSYKWTISKGKLPTGLSINASTGKITGKPTKAGTFNFTVKVTDKNGVAATKAFTVKVTQTTIDGTIPTTGIVKASYTGTLKVTGGTSAYTWSISKGTLPNGLKIAPKTGKITGTPTKAGTFNFTVKVADKNGVAATKAFKVKITATTVSGTIPAAATLKTSYTWTLKAGGGTSPYTWTISKGSLPTGMKINASTGKITGKPTKAGSFTFTVKAKDKNGSIGTKAYTVEVTSQSASKTATQSITSDSETDNLNADSLKSSIPATAQTETLTALQGNGTITLAATLNVASDDILETYEGRDSDLVKVKAGQPLTFIIGEWNADVSSINVYVDDKAVEGLTVEDSKFTLPAEMVHDDFKVSVKAQSEGIEHESEELYIISE